MANDQENFIVSARKYRPESWQQVIGQESITETLHNSITQDHMAHAYLFCGPRGVGKTTCARIFAKEINRSEEHSEDEDFAFNIFELDAASNNSVDDIRSLTDQVRIPPQVGQYKVYIIDEVHMLSKQAFNAFLKTLEEPPKHAIFILATTEKHKIIPTILSRCQIYDFNRIGVEDIVKQLKHIAESEHIRFEEEALHVIAQKADGAMRDALSIFDQLSSFTNDNLTYDEVLKNLHVLDYDYYFKITQFLVDQAYADVLVVFDEILKQGFDGHHFISGLTAHFRDLLVCQAPKTASLLEVGDSVKQKYVDQAKTIDTDWLIQALKLANETDFKYRNAPNPRILIETTLLSLASLGLEKKNAERVAPLAEPAEKKKLEQPPAGSSPSGATTPDTVTETPEPPAEITQTAEEKVESTPKPAEVAEPKDEPEPKAETTHQAEEPQRESLTSSDQPKRRRRKPSTVSLKLDDEPITTNATEEISEVAERLPVAEGVEGEKLNVEDAWKRICDAALQHGKSALYSILAKQDPAQLLRENELIVRLAHEVDEEEFGQHKADVLQQMRQLTGMTELALASERNEGKSEAKLFTPQDKFEYLAKQNPLLRKLKSDLDLDITY